MKISITEKTARLALDALLDWLDYIEFLDSDTRQRVIAVDELIRELEAEDYIAEKIAAEQERLRKANEEYMARKAAEAKK